MINNICIFIPSFRIIHTCTGDCGRAMVPVHPTDLDNISQFDDTNNQQIMIQKIYLTSWNMFQGNRMSTENHKTVRYHTVLLFYVRGKQLWSVNLTTLFLGRLRPSQQLTILSPVTDNCGLDIEPGTLALQSDALPTHRKK